LPKTRVTVEFYSGDLAQFVIGRLRPGSIRSGLLGRLVSGEFLRLGLADEAHYSIVPSLIGDGIPFDKLDRDVALHLAEVKPTRTASWSFCYEVRGETRERS
jgi:hypothetical protein